MLTEMKCNEKILSDFTELATDISGKLMRMKLFVRSHRETKDGTNGALGLSLKQTIDMLTLFGLFNFYDIDALSKTLINPSDLSKLKETRKKLNSLNATGFELVQKNYTNYNELDHLGLILYNMCLINLGIENKEALFELFKRVDSVEEFLQLSEKEGLVSKEEED